jgi:hypothetical protein
MIDDSLMMGNLIVKKEVSIISQGVISFRLIHIYQLRCHREKKSRINLS